MDPTALTVLLHKQYKQFENVIRHLQFTKHFSEIGPLHVLGGVWIRRTPNSLSRIY